MCIYAAHTEVDSIRTYRRIIHIQIWTDRASHVHVSSHQAWVFAAVHQPQLLASLFRGPARRSNHRAK